MIEPSSDTGQESLRIAPPSPGPPAFAAFDTNTLIPSPVSATVPPPYSPLYDMIGDEPTAPAVFLSDKSAPPPYTSSDPEPAATSLLHGEVAQGQGAQEGAQGQAQPVRLARRTPERQLSMKVRPLVSLRSAIRPAPPPASAISFVLVDADGSRSAVPELKSASTVPSSSGSEYSDSEPESDSDADYSDEGDGYEGYNGPDPGWCGRVAIWSAASRQRESRMQTLRRTGSMGNLQAGRKMGFESV